jgi:surfeit locus 1 family protein
LSAPPEISSPARSHRPRSWIGLLIPALLLFAALIALGTWQLQRKAWKEQLIASLDQKSAAAPAALPNSSSWRALDPAHDEYRRVAFTATFEKNADALVYASASAFRPDVSGFGVWVFTPARLPDGRVVVINRGFVPSDTSWKPSVAISPPPSADVVVTGAMRWPEHRSWFTPQDKADVFFVRDPAAIAAAKGWGAVAPFYIEQESPAPPSGWPQPGRLVPTLPNNHLQYVVTWYGLAVVLAMVFAAYVVKSRRDADRTRT